MRTWWLCGLVLAGCTGNIENTDETDGVVDTDTDTDSSSDAWSLEISTDEIAVAPGKSFTRTFSLLNAPFEVNVEATVDVDGCAEMSITGVDEDEPALQVTGGDGFLGRCMLTIEAYTPDGETDTKQIPLVVDVDWDGKVYQWSGGDDVSRIGGLLSHDSHLFVSTSLSGEAVAPSLGLEERDALGAMVRSGEVAGADWDGIAGPVAAYGDQRFVAVSDQADLGWVIPFGSDGVAGAPWAIDGTPESFTPSWVDADADGVRVVGETVNSEGDRGVVFASWKLDGTSATSSTYFAPQGAIRPAAVARTAEGWIVGGPATGAPFPEVEDGIEWGSYIARFNASGGLVSVERLGIDNTQIQAMHALPDGRLLVAGFMRNVDLDDQTTATGFDAFVRLYAPDGSVAWTETYATDADQRLYAMSIVDDVVIAAGRLDDSAFVAGLDLTSGETDWSLTWGETSTYAQTTTTHGLGVVVGGITGEDLAAERSGTFDRFMTRVSADGEVR